MGKNTREQVALRFEQGILSLMKGRAKALNRSFNNYILHLALEDLRTASMFPSVSLDTIDEDILQMAGSQAKTPGPSAEDMQDDPRLAAIWKR